MTKIDDGGPFHPFHHATRGVSKREVFAGQAMAALRGRFGINFPPHQIATLAVQDADALIAALEDK